ncbi:MAG: M20/M25/M40 family metallo-hydrolase [Alphaproteobacteria bacterium]|nr:M20/M25/M40 family metallo-hydrolase [Alphaproteobacteria bacterium]
MGLLRIWSLAALCIGLWLLAAYGLHRPAPLGPGGPASAFSAVRASAALGKVLGPEKPHPAGSAENEAVRLRLLEALAGLGVDARTQTAMSCFGEARWHAVVCGTVSNVFVQVTPGGDGDPVLLMAHLDSVAAGPGACDDGCGMATLLETIRALKAADFKGARPIAALFTDGEEDGLLGAQAFLRDGAVHPYAVINVEARGDQGPSYLFQTGKGNAPLIDLYADSVTHFMTSSLYGEIYKYMPNDTDLTPFLKAGYTGYNFALIGNIAAYHTPLDVRGSIDLSGLQQHGEAALNLSRALANRGDAALVGREAVYLDILGRWLPRMPAGWAWPLALACFAAVLLAGSLRRRNFRVTERPVAAFLMPPLLLAGAVGAGFGLHGLAAWISGTADPSFAHPVWLRWSLALAVWAMALLAAPLAGAISAWLWMTALAVATAFFAPGLSPYFLFPSLIAAPLLVMTVRGGRGPALLLSGVAALVIWLQLNAGTEPLMGLKVHAIFTVTAAFALVPVLPLLAPVRGPAWVISIALSATAALGLAVTAGLAAPYDTAAPQRMNITYLENRGKAAWLTDAPPTAEMRAAVGAVLARRAWDRDAGLGGYLAPRACPTLQCRVCPDPLYRRSGGAALRRQRQGRWHGAERARARRAVIPVGQWRDGARIGRRHAVVPHTDCATAQVTLERQLQGVWLRLPRRSAGCRPRRRRWSRRGPIGRCRQGGAMRRWWAAPSD